MKPLPRAFFNRPTLKVAGDLIGCILARRRGKRVGRSMITETEAYDGFKDQASHASHGKTKRNEVMFREAGHIYVYFTYGIHWMLNIVTGPKDYPAAILIRGTESVNGPARLTKKLGITGQLNGRRLGKASGLWIERPRKKPANGEQINRRMIKRAPRVGVDFAGPIWSKKKYRFILV